MNHWCKPDDHDTLVTLSSDLRGRLLNGHRFTIVCTRKNVTNQNIYHVIGTIAGGRAKFI